MRLTSEWVNITADFPLEEGTWYTIQNTSRREDNFVVLDLREAADSEPTDNPYFLRSRTDPWSVRQQDECVLFARAENPEEASFLSITEQP